MTFKTPLMTHWVISLAWATGMLFCWAPVQAQSSGAAPLRSEVLKPLAAAQEALKNNQPDQALSLTREALAVAQGFIAVDDLPMPANNRLLLWRMG